MGLRRTIGEPLDDEEAFVRPAGATQDERQPAPDLPRVGVIGLGKMGFPIAQNLIDRGFAVCGFRRSGSPEFQDYGGTCLASPADVADQSEVLISIVPTAADVHEVVSGPRGTLRGMRPGTIHLEMSTIPFASKDAVRRAVEAGGGTLLDCPVSGSPGMVRPRLATTFASGPVTEFERARVVLDAVSGHCAYAGDFGSGTRLKYAVNLLLAVHTAAAAEAVGLAERLGVDLDLLERTVNSSIGGSAVFTQRAPRMIAREWSPAPGPVSTLAGILEQIQDVADDSGIPLPVFGAAKERFDAALVAGWAELDIACVADLVTGRDALDTASPRR